MTANRKLAKIIMKLVRKRGPDKTICPSEVARKYATDDWRKYMKSVRRTAEALHKAGLIQIEQGGEVVEPEKYSGPIRLRIAPEARR